MKTAAELARGEIDARTAPIGNFTSRVVVWITRQALAGETQYDVDTYISGEGKDGHTLILVQVDSTNSIYKAREIQRMRLGEFTDVLSDMSDLVTP